MAGVATSNIGANGSKPMDPQCELERLRQRLEEGQEQLLQISNQIKACESYCGRMAYRFRMMALCGGAITPVVVIIGQQYKDIQSIALMVVVFPALTGLIVGVQKTFDLDKRAGGAKTLRALAFNKRQLVRDEWERIVGTPDHAERIKMVRALRHGQAICLSQIIEQANELDLKIDLPDLANDLTYECSAVDQRAQASLG